jgi:hypothetical protein
LVLGAALFGFGLWRFMRAVVEPYAPPDTSLVDDLYQRRARARGPRVVAMVAERACRRCLRGLKEVTSNITAVVTVADDGGSSGRLRDELGVPPWATSATASSALADAEPQMAELLQYRFPGQRQRRRLQGPRAGQPAHSRTH